MRDTNSNVVFTSHNGQYCVIHNGSWFIPMWEVNSSGKFETFPTLTGYRQFRFLSYAIAFIAIEQERELSEQVLGECEFEELFGGK